MRSSLAVITGLSLFSTMATAQDAAWRQHDPARPRPALVTPGAAVGAPPSDAVVLFDGTSLGAWRGNKGTEPAKWVIRDGYMEAAPGTGAIQTAEPLGDMQLHVEWSTPTPPEGRGQGRGNSGVIIMGLYEVQILDSYDNTTYADGQAAAVYGQYPPLVNASRPAGQWQLYDIIFRGPRWSATGKLTRPAIITVFHNGVLVQDHVALWGGTAWLRPAPYAKHAPALPLVLQDHSNPVRFRNIWMRPLPEAPAVTPHAGAARDEVPLTTAAAARYAGLYRAANGDTARIIRTAHGLGLNIFERPDTMPIVTLKNGDFTLRDTGARLHFVLPATGKAEKFDISIAEQERSYVRVP